MTIFALSIKTAPQMTQKTQVSYEQRLVTPACVWFELACPKTCRQLLPLLLFA